MVTGVKVRTDTGETSAWNDASPRLSTTGTSEVSTTVGAMESCAARHHTHDENPSPANQDLRQIQVESGSPSGSVFTVPETSRVTGGTEPSTFTLQSETRATGIVLSSTSVFTGPDGSQTGTASVCASGSGIARNHHGLTRNIGNMAPWTPLQRLGHHHLHCCGARSVCDPNGRRRAW